MLGFECWIKEAKRSGLMAADSVALLVILSFPRGQAYVVRFLEPSAVASTDL